MLLKKLSENNGDHPDVGDHDEKDEVNGKLLKGRKSFKQFQKKDKEDQDKDPVGNGNKANWIVMTKLRQLVSKQRPTARINWMDVSSKTTRQDEGSSYC